MVSCCETILPDTYNMVGSLIVASALGRLLKHDGSKQEDNLGFNGNVSVF